MNRKLRKIADKLLKDIDVKLKEILSIDEKNQLLDYLENTTGKKFILHENEDDWGSYADYSYYISESDERKVEYNYWPCYTR